LLTNCGGGNFKNQLKKADKSGADIALILGEDEAKAGKVTIKFLREEVEQQTLDFDKAIAYLLALE
jgi:histidyl-tRNA synthetase